MKIEELKQKYPIKQVNPYGECIIVPGAEFDPDWEAELADQGITVFLAELDEKPVTLVRVVRSEKGEGEKTVYAPGQSEESDKATKLQSDDKVARRRSEGRSPPSRVLKHWTDQDVATLKELYSSRVAIEDIAQKLSRSEQSIRSKRKNLKLKRDRNQDDVQEQPGQPIREESSNGKTSGRGRSWEDKELLSLRELYGLGVPVLQIAQKLDRSEIAVESKCQQLGLRRGSTQVELKREPESGLDAKVSAGEFEPESKKGLEHNGDLVKEFLSATSLLYPDYRHAAAVLLQAAAKEMERGEV